VRVKVHAVGLNPVDWKIGVYFKQLSYPRIIGLDVAGVIDKVGSGVTDWKQGDRVVYHGNLQEKDGGFAEYALTDALTPVRLPESVSFTDAAAVPCAGWTAYQALHKKLHVEKGKSILITAGSGGVGGFAVQFAKLHGLVVIATCSAKNSEYVKSLGADHVIDYNTENIIERAKQLTNGKGVDYWMDNINSDSAASAFDAIAFGGGLVCVAGTPSGEAYASGKWATKALSIHSVLLGSGHNAHLEAKLEIAAIGNEVTKLLEENKLKNLVHEVVTLEDVPKALARIKQGHVVGKIVAKLV
jgi:NADPH:quinone reductase-like Zn-dependent oxidoreductase